MKKFFSLIISLALCLGLAGVVSAEGTSYVASEQLDAVETTLYGTHQSNSMMERKAWKMIFTACLTQDAIFWIGFRACMTIFAGQTAGTAASCKN